jgi:hypothetical protein
MKGLLNAFPKALRLEAEHPVRLLLTKVSLPERMFQADFNVRLNAEMVSIPLRLYGDSFSSEFRNEKKVRLYASMATMEGLSPTQSLVMSCLLTRHDNGFVREDALCRIIGASEIFVASFVAQLASEYVYEILLQVWLRLDQLSPAIYGALFRDNPDWLIKLRQRMISYWDHYYRWDDYTSIEGGTHRSWRDPYIGFAIFDAFQHMQQNASKSFSQIL